MATAVKLLGKVAAGFVETAEQPKTADWAERLASVSLSRTSAKQVQGQQAASQTRSAVGLAGNSHMNGVASFFPLRADLMTNFRPTHLADSTDLFVPSFDIRGPVSVGDVEAHLTFTVEKGANGDWQMFQVTPTSGYPGIRVDNPAVLHYVASTTLQAVTARRIKAGLPWEPGVLVAGTRVVEALRELSKNAA